MPEFYAVISATQTLTMKVMVEADDQAEALELIEDGEFEEVMDETDQYIVSVNNVEFY